MTYANQIDGAQATPNPLSPSTIAAPKNHGEPMRGRAAVINDPIRLPTLVTASSQPNSALSPNLSSASFSNDTP